MVGEVQMGLFSYEAYSVSVQLTSWIVGWIMTDKAISGKESDVVGAGSPDVIVPSTPLRVSVWISVWGARPYPQIGSAPWVAQLTFGLKSRKSLMPH